MERLINLKEKVYNVIDKNRWKAVENSGNIAETNNYFKDIELDFNVYNQEVLSTIREKDQTIEEKNKRIEELEIFRNKVIDKMQKEEKAKEEDYYKTIELSGFDVKKLQYANNNIKDGCTELYNAIVEKDRVTAIKAHDKLQQNSTIIDALTVNHVEIDDMDK